MGFKRTTKKRQRQQRRRHSRRQRGGSGNHSEQEQIMREIEEKNKLVLPNFHKIPVVGPVLQKSEQLAEAAALKGLDMMGNAIGIDLDHPTPSLGAKLDDIQSALSDPNNVQKTKDILANAKQYSDLLVEASAPVIEHAVDKAFPVIAKESEKAVNAGLNTAVNVAEDLLGPFVGIPRTILSATEAFNATVNAGSEMVKGVSEAVQGTQENFKRLQQQQSRLPSPMVGGTLRRMTRELTRVGGRIRKSRKAFLSSSR